MANARKMNPNLKLVLDFGPLIVLFAGNLRFGIIDATAAFMVAMSVSIAITFAIERKLSTMQLLTAAAVLVFGGLTLWLNDPFYLKIKLTILYVIFAAALVGGMMSGRLFIKMLMTEALQLPDAAWRVLTWRFAGFFLALAIVNEIVWRNFSTNVWVAFKVWGPLPLTFLFIIAQTPFIARHQIETNTPSAEQ